MISRIERRYDHILRDILVTLREDYAGFDELWSDYEPRYYITVCGTAHHKNIMDDLLFLRTVSQMLATTGDRNLRFALRAKEDYSPWIPGFFTRRYGDDLIVTQTRKEPRLEPGDVITRINSASPSTHRRRIQKNFFFSDVPEREIWHGLLKMADHVLVRHLDDREEDISLKRYPSTKRICRPVLRDLGKGAVYLCPDLFDGSGMVGEMAEENYGLLDRCSKLIIDLRSCDGYEESDYLPLLPYVFKGKHIVSEIIPPERLLTNFTERNCFRKYHPLQKMCEGNGGDLKLKAYIEDLKSNAGKGWIAETVDMWEDMGQEIEGRAPEQVVLLTDTWCENAGEAFVEIAQRSDRVITIGRPTMGTLDYSDRIGVVLDEDFTLTYPISKRQAVADGKTLKGKGLPVNVYVPFTPDECGRDILLEKAIKL